MVAVFRGADCSQGRFNLSSSYVRIKLLRVCNNYWHINRVESSKLLKTGMPRLHIRLHSPLFSWLSQAFMTMKERHQQVTCTNQSQGSCMPTRNNLEGDPIQQGWLVDGLLLAISNL